MATRKGDHWTRMLADILLGVPTETREVELSNGQQKLAIIRRIDPSSEDAWEFVDADTGRRIVDSAIAAEELPE